MDRRKLTRTVIAICAVLMSLGCGQQEEASFPHTISALKGEKIERTDLLENSWYCVVHVTRSKMAQKLLLELTEEEGWTYKHFESYDEFRKSEGGKSYSIYLASDRLGANDLIIKDPEYTSLDMWVKERG